MRVEKSVWRVLGSHRDIDGSDVVIWMVRIGDRHNVVVRDMSVGADVGEGRCLACRQKNETKKRLQTSRAMQVILSLLEKLF